MIARLLSILLLLYALGFALFAVTLDRPADASAKDQAIVVITGGAGRIERGAALMKAGAAQRMLIAGADPSVTKADLAPRVGSASLLACCIDIGTESVDTRSNAEEAKRWLDAHHFTRFRLVTSDWHMRRAAYEFEHLLGDGYAIRLDAVHTEPNLMTLFAEYNKYVLRRLSVWLDV
ncbi:YdcF family protein [Sphingomonas sp. ASV193]|uniref:YdcF family protein n=1 Tax=Sphingomonas sp. ASV193 TaxID=3144405 RepID=UPI0032E88F35